MFEMSHQALPLLLAAGGAMLLTLGIVALRAGHAAPAVRVDVHLRDCAACQPHTAPPPPPQPVPAYAGVDPWAPAWQAARTVRLPSWQSMQTMRLPVFLAPARDGRHALRT